MTNRILIFIFIFIFILYNTQLIFSQPKPQKAPIDPDYQITSEELQEMQEYGIFLPPIKPDVDPSVRIHKQLFVLY